MQIPFSWCFPEFVGRKDFYTSMLATAWISIGWLWVPFLCELVLYRISQRTFPSVNFLTRTSKNVNLFFSSSLTANCMLDCNCHHHIGFDKDRVGWTPAVISSITLTFKANLKLVLRTQFWEVGSWIVYCFGYNSCCFFTIFF